MSGNSLGILFQLTTFGESHGSHTGLVIDGCPSGLKVDYDLIQQKINQRKTGIFPFTSSRIEDDKVEFLSGIINDTTTGTPIACIIRNTSIDSSNYEENKTILKPSSSYFTYWKKYGNVDQKGNGRASARETLARVIGGCFAMMFLNQYNISILAYTTRIGNISIDENISIDKNNISNALVCPDKDVYPKMMDLLKTIQKENDTIGAQISCSINNLPVGLGEPVFDKLNADLSKAIMSIPAAKGIEFGSGFKAISMRGSEHNDLYTTNFHTITNHSGGIQAGISNGETLHFSMAFKPISSIMKDQPSINEKGESTLYKAGGRHDICVVPRVLPVVEAMTALVIADHLLRFNAYKNH